MQVLKLVQLQNKLEENLCIYCTYRSIEDSGTAVEKHEDWLPRKYAFCYIKNMLWSWKENCKYLQFQENF